MCPDKELTGSARDGLTGLRTPFETRKPEFGGALGRG